MARHVELINEYLVEDGSDDFKFFDNKGMLVRCKDCKHRQKDLGYLRCAMFGMAVGGDFFCAMGGKNDE